MSKRLSLLLISGFWLLSLQAWGQLTVPPPQIYITTLNGNQVKSVDANGTIALTTPIYTDHSTTEDFPNFLPEGIALGQDGKLYVANTQNNKILRMNQNGSQVETIYDQSICGDDCPVSPEGPALDANGNLFFNTAFNHTGVWEIAGVTSIGFGGPFPAPTNAVGVFCSGAVCTTTGEGLAFGGTFPIISRLNSPAVKERKRPSTDAAFKSAFPTIGGLLAFTGSLRGLLFPAVAAPALPANDANLLIVDNSNDQVLIFDGTNEAVLIDNTQNCNDSLCLDGPIGIAVAPAANLAGNIAAGDIFVANSGFSKDVNHFDSTGKFIETFASFFTEPCDGECPIDSPIFLAIDPLGNLFVTTASNANDTNPFGGALGNVWEVTSNIVDSELVVAENDLTQNASNNVFAWGIALAETTLPLNPGGGTNIYNFGPFNFKVQYSADPNFANEFLTVEALLTTQAQLTAETTGGAFAGEQIVVYDGADGNGVTFVLFCQAFPNGPCQPVPEGYEVFTSYNSVPANFIPSNPNFLKKELGAGIYDSSPPAPAGDGDILTNFFVTRIDPTGAGRTKPGFSDFILGNLPPGPKTAANFGGFQPPLAPKNGRVFNSGDTLAVKFNLTGQFSAFDPTKVVARISVEMTSTPAGTPAANFKAIPSNLFLLRKGTFQFYLDLTGYAPGGYTLIVTSNSFPTTTVNFTVQ